MDRWTERARQRSGMQDRCANMVEQVGRKGWTGGQACQGSWADRWADRAGKVGRHSMEDEVGQLDTAEKNNRDLREREVDP